MQDLNVNFALQDCFFGGVSLELNKNFDPDKYSYPECGIGFDSNSLFSNTGSDWRKNSIIFGVDNSL